VAPKVGPLGIAPKKFTDAIEKQIPSDNKTHRLRVKVHTKTTRFEVTEKPTTSQKILSGLSPLTGKTWYKREANHHQHKLKYKIQEKEPTFLQFGSTSLSHIVQIAKENMSEQKTKAKTLTAAVMQVLGTCVSVKCQVNGKDPRVIQQQIRDGEIIVDDCLDGTFNLQ
jgi:large subunit ribosomal protein L12e